MRGKKMICIVPAMLLLFFVNCQAASFDEALTATSASLPLGADVGGMGNIATLEDFSSPNPAITAIMKEGKMNGTINYGYFEFAKTNLSTISGSLAGKIWKDTVLQISYGYGETPNRWINNSEKFCIRNNNTVDFQIGSNVVGGILLNGDEFYIGTGYAFTQSTQNGVFVTPTEKDIIMVDSNSHSATLGFAYKPVKQITFGAFGSRTWTRSQVILNEEKDVEVLKDFYDIAHIGFSVKVFESTTLAADYKHISFSSSSTKLDQYFVGIEQYIIKDAIALYVGIANGGPTAGLGAYFKYGGLNISYGHDIFPETRDFLGSVDAYMLSGYFNF